MKVLLAVLLAASLGVNIWLLATRDSGREAVKPSPPAAGTAAGTPSGGPPPHPSKEAEELRVRVSELEKALAEARESAPTAAELDPLTQAMDYRKPLAWRVARILGIEPEKDRRMASWKLGIALGEKPGSAREILELLKTESDPGVLAVLADLLRAGAATSAPIEDRRAFGELLRTAELPEVRTVCVRGLFMTEAFRGGFDEKTRAGANEMNGLLNAALRAENSDQVVGEIAEAYAAWFPPPEALEVLREAAARLPPGTGRRRVWEAIARGSFMEDQGASLFQQFRQASSADVRDDIAAGIARAGNSMGGGLTGGPNEVARKVEEARARFRIVFEGTTDATVRRSLARAATQGLNCVGAPIRTDDQKADAGRFFREVAALEPDPVQRERLERIAASFETKGDGAYADFDKVLSGKE